MQYCSKWGRTYAMTTQAWSQDGKYLAAASEFLIALFAEPHFQRKSGDTNNSKLRKNIK